MTSSAGPPGELVPSRGSTTRRLILRGTLTGWAQYATALGVTLILTPFVLRHVGPAAYGVWLLLTQAIGYSGLLDLGMQPALVRYVAEARASGNERQLRQLLGTTLRFYVVGAAACVLLGFVLAAVLPQWFDLSGVSRGVARQTAVIAGFAAAAALPATAVSGTLKGLQRFDWAAILGLGSNLVRALVTVMALSLGLGLPGLAAATLCGNVATLAAGALLLRRLTGIGAEVFSLGSRQAFARLVSVGAASLVGTAGWQLAYGSDSLLVGAGLTAVDAGHFGLAANIMVMISAMVGAFTGNLLPLASAYGASGDANRAQVTYLLGTRISLTLVLPPLALFVVEGPALLTAWVGPGVGQPTGAILQLLAIAYLPNLFNAAGAPLALGLGLHRAVGILAVSEGVIKVALSLLWIGKIGTTGVVLATLAASLIHHGLLWPRMICARLRIRPSALWTNAVRPLLAPAMALLGGLLLLHYVASDLSFFVRITAAAVLGAICWAPALLALARLRDGVPSGS